MAPDLRGIPGAGNGRGRRRRSNANAGFAPQILRDPRRQALPDPTRRRAGRFRRGTQGPRAWSPRRRRRISWSSVAIALGFVALFGFVFMKFWDATRVNVTITGIENGGQMTLAEASDLDIHIDIAELDLEEGVTPTLFLNGVEIDEDNYEVDDQEGVDWHPAALPEGTHTVAMSIDRPILDDASFTWTFTVDDTPPQIDVISPQPAAPICTAVSVTGTIEPGLARFTVDGEDYEVDDDGSFTLSFDNVPTDTVLLEAEDQAGNTTVQEIVFPVAYPSTQGVHVSAAAWGYEPLRSGIIQMVEEGKVSAVQLDIKDEGGIVGYDTEVELAHTIDAVRVEYDLGEAIEYLHSKGVRVIGRIVAFRDGPLARWAAENGRMDYVIQDTEGGVLAKYGGFTNVASLDVRQYNIDLAMEAVELGVDEILWDYVRRPEGNLGEMVFPGLQIAAGSTEAEAINNTVVGFLAESAEPLREACVYQGASLFGIAARNPSAIGQPVPAIARTVDYIAPMLYPSHWVRGEYRVDHPNAQPYDIVAASLADFQSKAAGSGVAFNLWVQDFSIGIPYGPEEVRAQIEAARDLGVDNWLLWDATVTYTDDAITPELVDLPDG